MTGLPSELGFAPVAGTATDCGAKVEDAGWAACVVAAPAPPPSVVETTSFTLVLEFAGFSLSVLVFGVGVPEVGFPPAGD